MTLTFYPAHIYLYTQTHVCWANACNKKKWEKKPRMCDFQFIVRNNCLEWDKMYQNEVLGLSN